ncbi:programmed cell death protein 1 isoform X4 [Marmota marmota marmota]|uniref:programmed cell death protein 1 isoform X4 n=1 Tax=Marmota marmota marmota TaxID=9994 RepID=UPI0020923010|nr:programmed cell death protein 1 isoform X4 [Marmota marmota marmota]
MAPSGLSEPGRDPRFRVTQLPSRLDFHMSVISAQRSDSGLYLCGAISLSSKVQIQETTAAELRVTDRVLESPTLEPLPAHPRPSPRPAGQLPGLVVGVTSVLVGVPVLLLLAWVLATTCSTAWPARAIHSISATWRATAASLSPCTRGRQRQARPCPGRKSWHPSLDTPTGSEKPQAGEEAPEAGGGRSKEQPLEEASEVPVSTLDYGELDFQWRERTPTPEPPASCIHTEYATIVFPSSPGRRGSADSPQGPQPLRPEDGHCSWPL